MSNLGNSDTRAPARPFAHYVRFVASDTTRYGIRQHGPSLRFVQYLQARHPTRAIPKDGVNSLRQHLIFWLSTADEDFVEDGDPKPESVKAKDEPALAAFLGRLRESNEAKCALQPMAARVVEALGLLDTHHDDVMAQIETSLDACVDKPVWALGRLTLMCLIKDARGSREAITQLGRRVFRLDIVHEHVRKKLRANPNADDVSVFLHFETALRQDLDLPVCVSHMHFAHLSGVTQEEIDAARTEALGVSETEFLEWLNEWAEWKRQRRLEHAKFIRYKRMYRYNGDPLQVPDTDMSGEPISDPVVLRGRVWSWSDLKRHWIPTGVDFFNRPLSCAKFKLVRRYLI